MQDDFAAQITKSVRQGLKAEIKAEIEKVAPLFDGLHDRLVNAETSLEISQILDPIRKKIDVLYDVLERMPPEPVK